MQIWILDQNPYQIASQLHDKHILSSCVDSAIMISGVAHVLKQQDPENYIYSFNEIPYKPFDLYHPLTQWLSSSFDHWLWHFKYWAQILYEYQYRFQKTHNCECVKNWVVNNLVFPIQRTELSFYSYLPGEYISYNYTTDDIVNAYREYYKIEKCENTSHIKWTNRERPQWTL